MGLWSSSGSWVLIAAAHIYYYWGESGKGGGESGAAGGGNGLLFKKIEKVVAKYAPRGTCPFWPHLVCHFMLHLIKDVLSQRNTKWFFCQHFVCYCFQIFSFNGISVLGSLKKKQPFCLVVKSISQQSVKIHIIQTDARPIFLNALGDLGCNPKHTYNVVSPIEFN